MKYLSVASGIEAATVAWHPLGWSPVAFAQFDPEHKYKTGPDFASAVLSHHYGSNFPGEVLSSNAPPNLGDMTKFKEWPDYADVNVLVGGTPCQTYSVAGLGAGLDDPRGDLALTYAAIARRYRPAWVVWENVGGVLSNDKGRSFASILGLLSGQRIEVPSGGWKTAGVVPGIARAYGLAWRVLDTQYVRIDGFGRAIPQRRRRVFVVGYLGDWRRAAAVLFEREGLCGNPPPSRRAGETASGSITRSFGVRGGVDEGERGTLIPDVAEPLNAGNSQTGGGRCPGTSIDDCEQLVPVAFKASHFTRGKDGAPADVAFSLSADADKGDQDQLVCAPVADPLTHGGRRSGRRQEDDYNNVAFSFQPRFARNDRSAPLEEVAYPLTAEAGRTGKGDSAQVVAFQEPIPIDMRQASRGDKFTNNRSEDSSGGAPGVGIGESGDPSPTIASSHIPAIQRGWSVRRLMPIECERLQGFSDGYTAIQFRGKPVADSPRYKVLGNSMSVNSMRWIGRRIQMVSEIEG